jgi:hypothetical protein
MGESLGSGFSWGAEAASTAGELVAGTDAFDSADAIVDFIDVLNIRLLLNCLDFAAN